MKTHHFLSSLLNKKFNIRIMERFLKKILNGTQQMPVSDTNMMDQSIVNIKVEEDNDLIVEQNNKAQSPLEQKQQISIIKRKLFQSKSFLNQTFFSSSKNSEDLLFKNGNQDQIEYETNGIDELKFYLEQLDQHFQIILQTKNQSTITIAHQIHKLIKSYLVALVKCIDLNKDIEKNAHKYDLNTSLKQNGYRTLSRIFLKCCEQTLIIVREMYLTRSSLLFTMKYSLSSTIIEFHTWLKLIEKLEILFNISTRMQKLTTETNSLFINSDMMSDYIEENLFKVASTEQEAFFGRTCAFQFCDSLKLPLTACAVALASYNDGYEAFQDSSIAVTAKSLFSGTKYMLNPELRAQKLSTVMKNADVEFCKAFWQLTETSLVQVGSNLMTPNVLVNIIKKIDLVPLLINKANSNETFTLNPPVGPNGEKTVLNIRVLSAEYRDGMQELDLDFACMNNNTRTVLPKSPYLVLHAHGGGFIAHSSKSHEIYLKPWCKELHVPIVSIDYSLAPEHPFPKASEECFYVYVWCLLNKDALGWTGEKIICVGDSAGGVLVTNIVQRSIMSDIRVPDTLIAIYTPFLLSYTLSPSRLLSVMDPLLNLGILWRCLAAYCGIDFKATIARNRRAERKLENSKSFDDELLQKSKKDQKMNKKKLKRCVSDTQINQSTNQFDENHQRLDNLRDLIGDSVYLIELLRNHPLPRNHFMSPLLTDDEVLKKFPKTYLVACQDSFLDDSIAMSKRLDLSGVNNELIAIDNGSPHGFLNMRGLTEETQNSYLKVYSVILKTINDFKNLK